MLRVAHINLAKGFRGGERQTAILIEELSKLGYFQTLFYRDTSHRGIGEYLLSKKIPNLNLVSISKPYFFHLSKLQNFNLLHSHEAKGNQLAYFANRLYKIPYLITRRVQFTPKKNFFNLAIYKNANSIVALSTAIKRDLEKLDSSLSIETIPSAFYNSGNLQDEPLPIEIGAKKIVGHIGAVVDSHKGQCTILETAKLLQDRKDIHFVLIGDGRDLERCKKESRELQNISFLGYLDNPQRFISNFSIFVFPSHHEGLGSTLLDVMVKGVPIIASNVGGITDIIQDGQNGYLISAGDSRELKNRILNILSDEVVRKRFVQNSLAKVQNFSPQNMAEKYHLIYSRISEKG